MLSTLGYAAVIAALLGAVVMTVAGLVGGFRNHPLLSDVARRSAYFSFAAMMAAIIVMEAALLGHDFSVEYVSRVGSRETPAYYTAISLWSSLDGSILFWGWILAGYAALLAVVRRRSTDRLTPFVLGAMGIVGIFFYGLLVGPANPFGLVVPTPENGPGPNPLLQNHPLMGLHPPLLYLGFVGLSVPFAFAIGALLSGNLEAGWLRDARRWMVAAWAFLSLGIVGGAWWSYEVLGWGGYWAWDPVENASFLPWLTATAFLHSVMVQERRGMLKTWNLSLIIGTFILTLFGTFLTRSGILDSVHAFTEGVIGPIFLGFIAFITLGSFALIAWRSDRLHAPGTLDGAVSRESAFILNNLIFVALTFTVLLGTVFPLVVEALRSERISVGPPYFDMVFTPLALILLFLMGVGPALPWRRATPDKLKRTFWVPLALGAATVAIIFLLGVRRVYPLVTFGFAGFVFGTIAEEFRKGVSARRRISARPAPLAFMDLFTRNGRRYGGYVVHAGIVVMAVGLAISGSWKLEREVTLQQGEKLEIAGYTVQFEEIWGREEPQRFVVGGTFQAWKGDRHLGEQQPRLNYYPTSQQPIATPAVESSLAKDLYLTLMAFDGENGEHATVRAIVNPAVAWLWIGGLIVGIGALIAIWPHRRPSYRPELAAELAGRGDVAEEPAVGEEESEPARVATGGPVE
ncbi:MAG: heme lyase CcmF/NrfE family subunit [Gemmatimonadota bacterium]|jgi:cytochrome c-type biogenesis protein CcmF|nr:MAG: heme lyase CcmF/NrfE family subunit [Gemmatimonadota bacterium]